MSITSVVNKGDQSVTISVSGLFDFESHQDFRDAYEANEEAVKHYVVDLTDTTYLDSSALGMLLLLRDYAGGDDADVVLVNCNNDVRKILGISNFELLFTIH